MPTLQMSWHHGFGGEVQLGADMVPLNPVHEIDLGDMQKLKDAGTPGGEKKTPSCGQWKSDSRGGGQDWVQQLTWATVEVLTEGNTK